MPALSTKDKLALRLSSARMERWNIERRKPAKNFIITASGEQKPVERCTSIAWAHGQEKPSEVVKPDATDKVHSLTDSPKLRFRSMAGKLSLHGNATSARVHTIGHLQADGSYHNQVILDCKQNDSSLPNDVVKGKPVAIRRDKDNAFKAYGAKKAQARIASGELIIERR